MQLDFVITMLLTFVSANHFFFEQSAHKKDKQNLVLVVLKVLIIMVITIMIIMIMMIKMMMIIIINLDKTNSNFGRYR